jgi:prevent-host-death family protein
MTSIQASLLEIRKNPAKYLTEVGDTPVTVTKRGKKVAVVIDPETAKEFWKWKEREELKNLYMEAKSRFESYGQKFLDKKNLKQEDLSVDELVELIANA